MSRDLLLVLGDMVAEMRDVESSVEFHTALLSAHRKLGVAGPAAAAGSAEEAADLQYSRTNFSYGSTPHGSWLALFEQCQPLRAAVDEMIALRGSADATDEYCASTQAICHCL